MRRPRKLLKLSLRGRRKRRPYIENVYETDLFNTLLVNRDETLGGSEIKDSLGYGRRGEAGFAHWVVGKRLKFGSGR